MLLIMLAVTLVSFLASLETYTARALWSMFRFHCSSFQRRRLRIVLFILFALMDHQWLYLEMANVWISAVTFNAHIINTKHMLGILISYLGVVCSENTTKLNQRVCEQLLPEWDAAFHGLIELVSLQAQDAFIVSCNGLILQN